MTLSYSISLVILAANCAVIFACFPITRKSVFLFSAAVVAITILTLTNSLLLHDPLQIFRVIPRGTQYLPSLYLLQKGNFAQKTFFTFSILTMSALTPAWGGYLANCFYTYGTSAHEVAAFVLACLMLTAYVAFMLMRGKWLYQNLFVDSRFRLWAIYSLYPIAAMSALNAMFYADGISFPAPERSTAAYVLLTLFIFAGFLILCATIINTHEKTRKTAEAEFARSVLSSGREHYQQMDELYEKLRILRHDYKYHLNAARAMLDAGDAKGADEYLTDVEQQIAEYDLRRYCSNTVINALIAGYAERCLLLNIKLDVSIEVPESLSIPDYDLCIIVGNLLENAIEACEKLNRNRVIKIETRNTDAQLLLMVKNSFNGMIQRDKGMPLSTKTNGGFGLRSITEVITRNGGDITVDWDDSMFTAYAAVML